MLSRHSSIASYFLELDVCNIIKAEYEKFDVINVYRFSNTSITTFTDYIMQVISSKKTQIVLGDFNMNFLDDAENKFNKAMKQRKFRQLVARPTHIKGGLLDQVWFYAPTKVSCEVFKIHPVYFSDHHCVATKINL